MSICRDCEPCTSSKPAWDLAVATQALTYLDPVLAAAISRVYSRQDRIAELNRGMIQSMYLLPWRENFDGFAGALEAYFGDLVVWEPELIRLYDDLIPAMNLAIRDSIQSPDPVPLGTPGR